MTEEALRDVFERWDLDSEAEDLEVAANAVVEDSVGGLEALRIRDGHLDEGLDNGKSYGKEDCRPCPPFP
jgi:hypothetical protein